MKRNILVLTSHEGSHRGGNSKFTHEVRKALDSRSIQISTVSLPVRTSRVSGAINIRDFTSFDASAFDAVLTLRWPSHTVRSDRKIVWFQHHRRDVLDLAGTEFGSQTTDQFTSIRRQALTAIDNFALDEACEVWALSDVVNRRLRRFNQIDADAIVRIALTYEALGQLSRKRAAVHQRILCLNRVTPIKRQLLVVQAMTYLPPTFSLCVAGYVESPEYFRLLMEEAKNAGVSNRIQFLGSISENEKIRLLHEAQVLVNPAFDEDSVSYPVLEAAAALTPVITCNDSGGILEFIEDRTSGRVVEPNPLALATAITQVCQDGHWSSSASRAAFSSVVALTKRYYVEPLYRLSRFLEQS